MANDTNTNNTNGNGSNGDPAKKKRMLPLLAVLTIIGLVGLTWYWYVFMRGSLSTDDANIEANYVALSSTLAERISRLAVDEGSLVQAGQALVYLDDTDLRAQQKQALATLEQVKYSVSLAKVNMEKTLGDYQRSQELFKSGSVSQEKFDNNRKAYESAQIQHSIAQAQVEVSKAQLEVLETKLSRTTIVSPINGIVAKKWVLAGNVVSPGQPIFSIYDPANIWVTANIEETKLSHIKLNDAVEISVDSRPGKKYQGKIIQLGSNTAAQFAMIPPSNAAGNFTKVTQRVPIKISIDNKDNTLLPGLSVTINIKTK
ncbi:MAG: HlyD family secretion protein [Candidatus Brocadiia bacterium]